MSGAPSATQAPILTRIFRDRTELFAFFGLLDAVNGFSDRLTEMLRLHDLLGALVGAGGISVVGWFAFYAVATIALEPEADAVPDGSDIGVAGLMLVIAFLPLTVAGGVGLLVGGLWLAARSRRGSRGRRVAALLLALAGPTLLGPLLLRLFGPPILAADAQLAAAVAGTQVIGNYVGFAGRGAGDGLYVATGCSSLHNISLALLLWTAIVQLLRLPITRGLVASGVAAGVAMAVINVGRLGALALYPDHFAELHDGAAADLIGLLSLVVAGAIIAMGAVAATPRRA